MCWPHFLLQTQIFAGNLSGIKGVRHQTTRKIVMTLAWKTASFSKIQWRNELDAECKGKRP